jgi:hypothetical protein
MKMHLAFIIIPLVSAILFSGCNPGDMFAQLATSNEEQGAREQFERNQMLEAKQKKIDQKRNQFTFTAHLTKINETDPYDAFIFVNNSDTDATIELEAILPNPGRQIYELWLRDPATKEIKSLGALEYNQTDDYSLSYSGDVDTQSFSSVVLTREANPDNQPETVIMTGSLTTSTP